jgi:catechol 2,3-dioxygenase-like lactoylglutathione lyase family enzyme
MPAIAQLAAVTLDCPDPAALAEFYRGITGWEVAYTSEEFVGLSGDGLFLGFQRAPDLSPPRWPDPSAPQQMHLDFNVPNLDEAEARLLEIGATKAEVQPGGERWRVFIDPAGHPFCATVSG